MPKELQHRFLFLQRIYSAFSLGSSSLALTPSWFNITQWKISWRKETWKQIKVNRARSSAQLKEKQQLQICWNTRFKTVQNNSSKMFPCWFCTDVSCYRKNIIKRERNINFFTVPTLHDSQNFTNDTTEKCYLRLIQCITSYWR